MRPVLVGMNNPVSSAPEHALFPYPQGCTGWRAWQLLRAAAGEVTRRQYLDAFERVNVLPGRQWDRHAARLAGPPIRDRLVLDRRAFVALGAATREALNTPLTEPGEWRDYLTGARCTWLPHPSGRNRWYNDPWNAGAAARVLAELYRRPEPGAAPAIEVGTVLRTSYGTGPYRVVEMTDGCDCPSYADSINIYPEEKRPRSAPHAHLTVVDAGVPPEREHQQRHHHWLNGYAPAAGGRWRSVWSDDELIVEART